MGCGINCIKYLVFTFNFLFACKFMATFYYMDTSNMGFVESIIHIHHNFELYGLTGLFTIVVGAVIQSSYTHYENFIGQNFWTAPILLIIVGTLIFVISFFGCCGALRESSLCMSIFSIFLMLIFIAEIAIGITGYVKHAELKGVLEHQFNKTLDEYANSIEAQHAWSLVQSEMECCGIKGPSDWKKIFNNKTLPSTCCHLIPESVKNCTAKYASRSGCLPKFLKFLDSKSLLLGAVGIGIAIVQLLGVIFACTLSRAFRENYETV